MGQNGQKNWLEKLLRNIRESKLKIATKGSHEFDEKSKEVHQNNQPEYLKQQVENSLKRLQTDYIDLYYIHFPDDNTPKDQAVAALQGLRNKGRSKSHWCIKFHIRST